MKCDVIIDLQYGSTAKGKIAQTLAMNKYYDYSVRVQSIQAGHTIIMPNGKVYKMQTIPCAWVNPDIKMVLGPGCFIEINQLLREIDWIESYGFSIKDRLYIDYRSTLITEQDKQEERENKLTQKIGSTSEGAGSSLIRKIWRKGGVVQAKDAKFTNIGMVCDTVGLIQNSYVLLEGCQGGLLGIHTTPYYPFCTSRECSASAIMGEAGISPFDVRDIYGVFRTFPIRVGGNSGPTGGKELTWDDIREISGDPNLEVEKTTVTNRERRIFEFSISDFVLSLMINKPNKLVCNFVNYLNSQDLDTTKWDDLSHRSKKWILDLEDKIGQKIDYLGTGKNPQSWIYR